MTTPHKFNFQPKRQYDFQDSRIAAIGNLKATIAMADEVAEQAGRDTLLALAEDVEMIDPELAQAIREAAR